MNFTFSGYYEKEGYKIDKAYEEIVALLNQIPYETPIVYTALCHIISDSIQNNGHLAHVLSAISLRYHDNLQD